MQKFALQVGTDSWNGSEVRFRVFDLQDFRLLEQSKPHLNAPTHSV